VSECVIAGNSGLYGPAATNPKRAGKTFGHFPGTRNLAIESAGFIPKQSAAVIPGEESGGGGVDEVGVFRIGFCEIVEGRETFVVSVTSIGHASFILIQAGRFRC
jgi:hypothetical protein